MANAYSMDDLLEFLDHAGNRGLMPAATAQALAVASRNVLGILTEDEKADLGRLDLDAVLKRFTNKRGKDFNPSSLKEYGRRVRRAVELFGRWREDPANFTVKTREGGTSRKRQREPENGVVGTTDAQADPVPARIAGTYQSSLPVRAGLVVTLLNVPYDLTDAEAQRLADFVKMLAIK
jgi:hypothetical protein